MKGNIERIHQRMLYYWSPNSYWNRDDLIVICMLLNHLMNSHGHRADPIYWSFADRLKSAEGDRLWHSTIWGRAKVVADYEGQVATRDWLHRLTVSVSAPTVGIVYLALGNLLMREGEIVEARKNLRTAVQYSLTGIEWFSLEALNAMAICLGKLGDIRLAFEYARSHTIQSYILGRINDSEIGRALRGLSALFGQIDYWVEIERNFAKLNRSREYFSTAAEMESQAAFRLAEIGAVREAAQLFLKAAIDADHWYLPSDRPFAITCRQLARLIDPTPIQIECIDEAAKGCRELWCPPDIEETYNHLAILLRQGQYEQEAIDNLLRRVHHHASRRSGEQDHGEFLNLVQMCAIVGRFFLDHNAPEAAARVWLGVVVIGGNECDEAVFVLALEWLAEVLLDLKRPQEALEIARSAITQQRLMVHERFVHHAIAARSLLMLNKKKEAYNEAITSLSDWNRVFEGLYIEEHKAAWLQRGEKSLLCAIDSIRDPVPWMNEQKRLRELFRLTEISKARILSDMVANRDFQLGAFGLVVGNKMKNDIFQAADSYGPDWLVPLMVQCSAFPDSYTVTVYDEKGGTRTTPLDIQPIEYAVRLPESYEKRLVASAASLSFDQADLPKDESFSQDLKTFLTPS